jgi:hypothetical protein
MMFYPKGCKGAKWLTQLFSTDRMSGARWIIISAAQLNRKMSILKGELGA